MKILLWMYNIRGMIKQEENFRRFRLQFPLAFIGEFVYPVGEDGIG